MTKDGLHVCVGDGLNTHDVLVGVGEKGFVVSFFCVDGLVKSHKDDLPQVKATDICFLGLCQPVDNFKWEC